MLIGRSPERRAIDSLVSGARAGRSGVLVITGEAGIGKTVLLGYADAAAAGMRVHRVVGTELGRDLGGGLSQLEGASTQDLPSPPEPQARALAVALDLRSGPSADRFAVGAATLGCSPGARRRDRWPCSSTTPTCWTTSARQPGRSDGS